MKLVALIPLLFACISVKAITTTIPAKSDTAMPKSILHKEALLKEFGDNDTCRALIEYWYTGRSFFGVMAAISGAVATMAGVWMAATDNRDDASSGNGSSGLDFFDYLGAVLVFSVSASLFVLFLPLYLSYPRKKLLRILNNFKETGSLPKKYLSKIKSRLQKNSK